MNCKQARKSMQPLLDDALDSRRTTEIRSHLDRCAACREKFASLEYINRCLTAETMQQPADSLTRKIVSNAHARISDRNLTIVPRWMEALTFVSVGIASLAVAAFAVSAGQASDLYSLTIPQLVPIVFALGGTGFAAFTYNYYVLRI